MVDMKDFFFDLGGISKERNFMVEPQDSRGRF
jgi:hypothetical protein